MLTQSLRRLSSLVLTSALLAGCASGPRLSEKRASIPPIPEGNGRIYFYRTTTFGAAIQPGIRLNGEKVGVAKPRGVFYVDRPPGPYEVETKTEVTRKLSLSLDPAQTQYVRFNMGFGVAVGRVTPELVEPAIGEAEVAKCHLMSPGGDE
jgi:hypothetical protein